MYNCTFTQKLVDTRLEIAKLMLLYSEKSVGEISRLCGFNSPNYFFTSFRDSVGMSPRQFRTNTNIPFKDLIIY